MSALLPAAINDPVFAGLIVGIEPTHKQLGTYRELTYDAQMEYAGLTWYRVRGGFGSDKPGGQTHYREDWVADVPASVSVSTSSKSRINGPLLCWGFGGISLADEIEQEIGSGLRSLPPRLAEARTEVQRLEAAIQLLRDAQEALR